MAPSIVFLLGKKEACVRTEEVSSIPVFLFIKLDDGSINFFSEFPKFGNVNSNPLTVNSIAVEYLSGKFQCRAHCLKMYVFLLSLICKRKILFQAQKLYHFLVFYLST